MIGRRPAAPAAEQAEVALLSWLVLPNTAAISDIIMISCFLIVTNDLAPPLFGSVKEQQTKNRTPEAGGEAGNSEGTSRHAPSLRSFSFLSLHMHSNIQEIIPPNLEALCLRQAVCE